MLIDFVTEHSSISMLDKSINDYSVLIWNWKHGSCGRKKLTETVTAMEKALNEMYSQSMWLAQQMECIIFEDLSCFTGSYG